MRKYPELWYKYRKREFWCRGTTDDGELLSLFTGGRQQNFRGCQTVLARRDAPAGGFARIGSTPGLPGGLFANGADAS